MSVFLLCSHSDISSARWSPIFQGSSLSLDIVSDRYKPNRTLKHNSTVEMVLWVCPVFRLAMMGSSFRFRRLVIHSR